MFRTAKPGRRRSTTNPEERVAEPPQTRWAATAGTAATQSRVPIQVKLHPGTRSVLQVHIADVQAQLPKLSMYMGHASIESTAYYLRWTDEIAALASQRFGERFAATIGGRS